MIVTSVPEQSAALMEALSGGQAFWFDSHLFLSGDDWLIGIGYPVQGAASPTRFAAALELALKQTRATDCFAIAPELPRTLLPHQVDSDRYYVLPAGASVPGILCGPVCHAREKLRVDETRVFTPAHRRLWSEFMGRVPLPPRVRRLYAVTEAALSDAPRLRLLNAWDAEGRLAACLVLDYAPETFVSYIIGAHSRTHYTPHAPDLLFAEMLERASLAGKQTVHLGLGVNEGILRFKRKWGGIPAQPYQLAAWRADASVRQTANQLAQTLLAAPAGLSKRQIFALLPEQRPYAMLWKLEKNGRTSWIGGSAHFFCCSFEHSLRRLFAQVDTVLLEGPIDPDSLNEVERHGRSPEPGTPRVVDFFDEDEVRGLEATVRGPTGALARLCNCANPRPAEVRALLATTRPWYAFFSLWTAFLERHGWAQSVDMEVWNTALDMGKAVIGMESLAEQIASLESAPLPRIVRFLKGHRDWGRRMRNNRAAYLAGDLTAMLGTSAEFPTRTEHIIGRRDQRFRERMRPYLERGGAAVFVGTAHMCNLRPMLAEDGFTVTRVLPTLRHRLRAFVTRDASVVLAGNPQAAPCGSNPAAPAPLPSASLTTPLRTLSSPPSGAPGAGPTSGEGLRGLTAQALVPEQLLPYVRAVSGGTLRACDEFAAWVSPGALVLVAYPPDAALDQADTSAFRARVERAVACALRAPELKRLTVLAPFAPAARPVRAAISEDAWWFMDLPFVPGQKLRNMLRRAQRDISIQQEAWGAEQAALVDVYLKQRQLAPGTRHIFTRLDAYLAAAPNAVLFAARDAQTRLQGFCIGDFSALSTAFYMFAFRAASSPPGTSDALLAALADEAVKRGLTRLNLGLGIDAGIGFFKQKWRAKARLPYCETSWSL